VSLGLCVRYAKKLFLNAASPSLFEDRMHRTIETISSRYGAHAMRLLRKLVRTQKRRVKMSVDVGILVFSLWFAFCLRLGSFWPEEINEFWWLFFLAPLLAIPVFFQFGMYRTVVRYVSSATVFTIGKAVSLHVLLLVFLTVLIRNEGIPRSVFILYWLIGFTLLVSSRLLARDLYWWFQRRQHPPAYAIIFGAGKAGAELASTLQAGRDIFPVAFVDDKSKLHNREVAGLKVFPRSKLESLIKQYGVGQILLAIPSASPARRKEVLAYFEHFPVRVQTVPSLSDLVWGRASVDNLRDIDIEDLLGRAQVQPDKRLMGECITGKSVVVTGAGGSIGSELARQILVLKPTRLVLYEASEYALYQIERELRAYLRSHREELADTEVVPILGTVTDERTVTEVFRAFRVQTVYHAAAYKHVPLVEQNLISGIHNNIFGTLYAAKAAIDAGVATFILISTDKAVRPTSVMGATKRMAEMLLQGLASNNHVTCFNIVRFGNVLGSSGSVVPLFREQIEQGGPVTVTHPEVYRYFMTIPEAAQLVIQAGAMGTGGEVFVLDMGELVRIDSLARKMIAVSGYSVRDENNPNGDIAIEYTGLRPGEKLTEELLIGSNVTKTEHPRILRAEEGFLSWPELLKFLERFEQACAERNTEVLRSLLEEAVEEYRPQCGIQDRMWLETHPENRSVH